MSNTTLLNLAKTGDREAREKIVTENMGLVWSVVKKFLGRGYEAEDLAQIGSIGLMKAIDKFDTKYGVQFSTYAFTLIMGEIKRFLRDDGIIKVSRGLKEAAMKGYAARERLYVKNRCEPGINEISEECGIDSDVLIQAFDAVSPPESIYAEVYEGEKSGVCLIDRISADDTEDEIIDKVLIQNILQTLTPRERQVIVFRYFKGKTQAEISKIVGVSQVQVSRIEKAVLKRLRENFALA